MLPDVLGRWPWFASLISLCAVRLCSGARDFCPMGKRLLPSAMSQRNWVESCSLHCGKQANSFSTYSMDPILALALMKYTARRMQLSSCFPPIQTVQTSWSTGRTETLPPQSKEWCCFLCYWKQRPSDKDAKMTKSGIQGIHKVGKRVSRRHLYISNFWSRKVTKSRAQRKQSDHEIMKSIGNAVCNDKIDTEEAPQWWVKTKKTKNTRCRYTGEIPIPRYTATSQTHGTHPLLSPAHWHRTCNQTATLWSGSLKNWPKKHGCVWERIARNSVQRSW